MTNMDRRDFLRASGRGLLAGFFGLGLTGATMRDAYGIAPDPALAKYDAVLQLFMTGAPTQTDTWDPKPGSANNLFNTINLGANDQYGDPIRIANHFQNLSNLVQSDPDIGLGLVRSVTHGTPIHGVAQGYMSCFWDSPVADRYPSTASVMAHYFADQADVGSVVVNGNGGEGENDTKGGTTPPAFTIYRPRQVKALLRRPAGVNRARYNRRRDLLRVFNQGFKSDRPDVTLTSWDQSLDQAHTVTQGGNLATAFDLDGKPSLPGGANADAGALERLLMAQECVKAGVPYVCVSIGGNDTHQGNRQRVIDIWRHTVDPAISQLAQNLKASGKKVLIAIGGEFGRTPNTVASGRDGRDHWASGFTWAFLSINQPAFRTNAVGRTGPNGMWTLPAGNLRHPVLPAALGGMIYRSLGYAVGSDPRTNVPTVDGTKPPVDPAQAASTSPGGAIWLQRRFGLA